MLHNGSRSVRIAVAIGTPAGAVGIPHAATRRPVGEAPNRVFPLLMMLADPRHPLRCDAVRLRCGLVRLMRLMLVVCGSLLFFPSAGRGADGPSPSPQEDFEGDIRPLLERYCFDCHSGEGAEAGLDLASFKSADAVRAHREPWEKVFDLVRIQAMPPEDADQPEQHQRQRLVDWLDHTLFYVDCENDPDPGRVTVRRLNRTEYNNTIRDLIGVDFSPAADFPSDDVGYGFDNIGDVLSISPLHMEKYLDAAEQITARAILAPEDVRVRETVLGKDMRDRGSARDGSGTTKVFPSTGTASAEFRIRHGGRHTLRTEAAAEQAGEEPAKMEIRIGREVVKTFEINGHREYASYDLQHTFPAGRRTVSVSFINDFYDPKAKGRGDRNLHLRSVEIEGPEGIDPDDLPETHRRLMVRTPKRRRDLVPAATENLKPFLARAFRRPVSDAEAAGYARFVRLAVDRGDSFERGTQIAVQAVLVSPEFLFRIEHDPNPKDPDAPIVAHELNQFEIASRLSYFLWSSMPDEELFALARANKLRDERVLRRQVERMMADPRSGALIENFTGQWLGLRNLHSAEVMPDEDLFPEFTDALRADLGRETFRFVEYIVREDRSILELLDGRYTFVNERLAKLYGIEGVEGDEFRKVDLIDGRRAGLLTQGSILTLTSYPDRTSPVKRGEWILTNILGDEPPPPPPGVPPLDETQSAKPDLPLRKQMELHRSDPGCASCHRVMDPIGFGFENFDPIGRWREQQDGHDIDATGRLPSGETFTGPRELIDILRNRQDQFSRCLTEKLLTYALGRGLEYYDRCAVDRIVSELSHREHRFSALVKAIVTSRPFLMRRAEPDD